MIIFKPIKSITESELKQFQEIAESYNFTFNPNDEMTMAFEKIANDVIVGFIGFSTKSNTNYTHVKCICVRQSFMNKGIGKGLLRIAKVISKRKLYICLSKNDPVINYFQKQGFDMNDSSQFEDTICDDDKVIMIDTK